MSNCPCGSGLAFDAGCGPIIAGSPATTAEALMRSRYSAYVMRAYAHLGSSLSAEQRKDFSADDAKRWAESSEWLGLTIHRTDKGGPADTTGLVEFTARFKTEGKEQEHVEVAVFNREDDRWVYAGSAKSRPERPLSLRQREEIQKMLRGGGVSTGRLRPVRL